jgi:hypothetical protein
MAPMYTDPQLGSVWKRNPQMFKHSMRFQTSGKKLILGLLATITIPSASAIFKRILEVVFCEGVQHRLQFCLNHFSCIKMEAFQFYLQLGKQRKVGLVGDDSHVVLGQIFPGEK